MLSQNSRHGAKGSGYLGEATLSALPTPLNWGQRLGELLHFKGFNSFNTLP